MVPHYRMVGMDFILIILIQQSNNARHLIMVLHPLMLIVVFSSIVELLDAQGNRMSGQVILYLIAGNQAYGLNIQASTDYLNIIGNDLRTNTTSDIINSSTGTHNNIITVETLQVASLSHGVTSSISTGSTVNHRLSSTPSVVILTAADGTASLYYPSSLGSTTFTINFTGGGSHVSIGQLIFKAPIIDIINK